MFIKNIHQKKAIKEEDGFHFSRDYDKFWELKNHERFLISTLPGWSTHCDFNHLSPIIDWNEIINETYYEKTQKEVISLNYK